MRTRSLGAALSLSLAACVTPQQRPVVTEAPAPQAEQVKAQAAAQAPAAPRYKRKVAIGRFSNETNYGRSLLADADLDRLGKQASDMLSSRLVMSQQFLVLERPDAAKLVREQEVAGSGAFVGADTLIIGSVTEFGRSVSGKVGFLSSTKLQLAKAKVDVRLVDVRPAWPTSRRRGPARPRSRWARWRASAAAPTTTPPSTTAPSRPRSPTSSTGSSRS